MSEPEMGIEYGPTTKMSIWRVRYLCCGIPHGFQLFATWEEADAQRQRWVESADTFEPWGPQKEMHERVGILESALAGTKAKG